MIVTVLLVLLNIGSWNSQAQISLDESTSFHSAKTHHVDLSGTVTLDALIQAAQADNPTIQAAQQTANAKKALVSSAKTLPDPIFTFSHMGDIIPLSLQYGDSASARIYTIEQEVPFPGKLGLRGKVASMEAELEEWNHILTHRQIISEIKQAYFDLFLIHKSIEIVENNKELLESLVQIATTKYQVGQGIQQDVLKAQVEISRLLDRLAVLEQRRWIAEAQINNLLYRPPDAPVGTPAPYLKSELQYSLEELIKLAQANSPSLKVQEYEVERRQYSLKLAQSEYLPDFSFGFSYFDRDGNPQMYGLEAKAKLPLYFWRKQKPEVDSARSNLEGARKMRNSTSSSISFQIRQNYTLAITADKLIKLYATGTIPQTDMSLKSAIANYQTGKVNFLNVIDSQAALLEYQLKYQESLDEFQKALAKMEPLVGIDLICAEGKTP